MNHCHLYLRTKFDGYAFAAVFFGHMAEDESEAQALVHPALTAGIMRLLQPCGGLNTHLAFPL